MVETELVGGTSPGHGSHNIKNKIEDAFRIAMEKILIDLRNSFPNPCSLLKPRSSPFWLLSKHP
jgi:hypothetical protein